MQNMDFHTRKGDKNFMPQFDAPDPEFFSRMGESYRHEEDRGRKKAARMMSLIIALCIISFTSGLVLGIKFASGAKANIVDDATRKTVSDLGKKVTMLMGENTAAKTGDHEGKKNAFPRDEFPYVIKIGSEFDMSTSKKIAEYLSPKGHTVILAKHDANYRVYVGPYKNEKEAESCLKKILCYNNSLTEKANIIKR